MGGGEKKEHGGEKRVSRGGVFFFGPPARGALAGGVGGAFGRALGQM